MSEREQHHLRQLASEVSQDPGGPGFARLADAYRRSGQLERALSVASAGLALSPENVMGRVVLGLTLMQRGDGEAARKELEGAIAVLSDGDRQPPQEAGPASAPLELSPIGEPLADEEIARAFATAEADPSQMRDANTIAEEAMRLGGLARPEIPTGREERGRARFDSVELGVFATETMAALAEDQGDVARAQAIRQAIPARQGGQERRVTDPAAGPTDPAMADSRSDQPGYSPLQRERIISTLETWLLRIRRGTA